MDMEISSERDLYGVLHIIMCDNYCIGTVVQRQREQLKTKQKILDDGGKF